MSDLFLFNRKVLYYIYRLVQSQFGESHPKRSHGVTDRHYNGTTPSSCKTLTGKKGPASEVNYP